MESWISVEPDRYLHNSQDTVINSILLASVAAESWAESTDSCQHTPKTEACSEKACRKLMCHQKGWAWDAVKCRRHSKVATQCQPARQSTEAQLFGP